MASIVITKTELSDLHEIENEAGRIKLLNGMNFYGDRIQHHLANDEGEASVILSLEDVWATRGAANADNRYHIYAFSRRRSGIINLLKLKNPRYNSDETKIIMGIEGLSRRFIVTLREDSRYRMNVSFPIFQNPFLYVDQLVNIVQESGLDKGGSPLKPADASRVLFANSLISRCK